MNALLEELTKSLPDAHETARVVVRLFAALIAGALIGWQREHSRTPAGLRTHMLVCMGVALFVLSVDGLGQDGRRSASRSVSVASAPRSPGRSVRGSCSRS